MEWKNTFSDLSEQSKMWFIFPANHVLISNLYQLFSKVIVLYNLPVMLYFFVINFLFIIPVFVSSQSWCRHLRVKRGYIQLVIFLALIWWYPTIVFCNCYDGNKCDIRKYDVEIVMTELWWQAWLRMFVWLSHVYINSSTTYSIDEQTISTNPKAIM